jgi:hypothetical protein
MRLHVHTIAHGGAKWTNVPRSMKIDATLSALLETLDWMQNSLSTA